MKSGGSRSDPEWILNELGLNKNFRMTVDIGCGYGMFTIPAARKISGTVEAMDIGLSNLNSRPLGSFGEEY